MVGVSRDGLTFDNDLLGIGIFVELRLVVFFSLLRVGNLEVGYKILRFLVPFLLTEERVGLSIKSRVDIEGVVVRDADVVVEDVEAGVAVLADRCFLLGVEVDVDLFRQDDGLDDQRRFDSFFLYANVFVIEDKVICNHIFPLFLAKTGSFSKFSSSIFSILSRAFS